MFCTNLFSNSLYCKHHLYSLYISNLICLQGPIFQIIYIRLHLFVKGRVCRAIRLKSIHFKPCQTFTKTLLTDCNFHIWLISHYWVREQPSAEFFKEILNSQYDCVMSNCRYSFGQSDPNILTLVPFQLKNKIPVNPYMYQLEIKAIFSLDFPTTFLVSFQKNLPWWWWIWGLGSEKAHICAKKEVYSSLLRT